MALYLPQENVNTGQLEFTPAGLYPDPTTERVFIASDAASGKAPTLPKILTKLPGFAHATTLFFVRTCTLPLQDPGTSCLFGLLRSLIVKCLSK